LNAGKGNNMWYTFPFTLYKYFTYYYNASNGKGHGVHSPFVFSFITQVLNNSNVTQTAGTTNKFRALVNFIVQFYKPVSVVEMEADKLKEAHAMKEIQGLDTVGLFYLKRHKNQNNLLVYFQALLQKVNAHSMLIFEGIHASSQSEKDWNFMKNNTQVRLSIDLFRVGILFFREEQLEKENFIIRF